MSPEHLKKLRELSEAFEEGDAGHEQIRQLNEILTLINTHHVDPVLIQSAELNANKS